MKTRKALAQMFLSPWIFLVFFLSLFLLPLLVPGIYDTHDGEALIARIAAYARAFGDFHIPPRWAGNLNYGFGAPVFIFFYPLMGYLGALLHALGVSYENAYKLLAAASFLGSGISFFAWIRLRTQRIAAFIAALFYALSPYHFLNLYVRGDVGELMALAVAPMVLWAIEYIAQRPRSVVPLLVGGASYALLILSHQGVALLVTPVLVGYAIVRIGWSPKELMRLGLLVFIGGAGVSAYFWIPALLERQYTAAETLFRLFYRDHFLSLGRILAAPWGFGDRVNLSGGLAPQIGPVHMILIPIALWVTRRVPSVRRVAWYWFGAILVGAFFMFPVSDSIWRFLPLWYMDFPWRMMILVHLAVAALLGTAISVRSVFRAAAMGSMFLVVASLPLAQTVGRSMRPDRYYEDYPGTTEYHGKVTTIWSAGDPDRKAASAVEVIDGRAEVSVLGRMTQRHSLSVDAATEAKLLDNTFYFPGWKVYVNGQETSIQFQDPSHPGLITFAVPTGRSLVSVVFKESPIRLVADAISFVSIAVVALFAFKHSIQSTYA